MRPAIGAEELLTRIVICALAGPEAQRRAVQGSEPGSRKMLSRRSILAHHEAGHAVANFAFGRHVYEASIVEDVNVKVGRSSHSGGFVLSGNSPTYAGRPDFTEMVLETDFERAAKYSWILSREIGWRGCLKTLRELRRYTREMIWRHWPAIAALANALERNQTLGQAAIEEIVERAARAPRIPMFCGTVSNIQGPDCSTGPSGERHG
jgi:hypothetical protein